MVRDRARVEGEVGFHRAGSETRHCLHLAATLRLEPRDGSNDCVPRRAEPPLLRVPHRSSPDDALNAR